MRAIYGYSEASLVSNFTTRKEEENKINLLSLFLILIKDNMHCLRKFPTSNNASDVKLLIENSFAFDFSVYILVYSCF